MPGDVRVPGTGRNKSLNAEWARLTNYGNKTRALTGWIIRDRQGHLYGFPKFRLQPGRSVRLHTGQGKNTARDVYWRQDWYVCTNTGDRAVLKNKGNLTVDACKWRDGDGDTTC